VIKLWISVDKPKNDQKTGIFKQKRLIIAKKRTILAKN
jgi:hypothetical protein